MRNNKSKTAEYHREWYHNNKGARREQIKKWQDKRREDWKLYKSTLSCKICNEKESCCLDFHHLDPTQKDKTLSSISHAWGKERLEKELNKCIVLCSNCHRKVHAGLIQLEE